MDISEIKKKIQEKWPNDYTQDHALAGTLEDIEKFPELLKTEFQNFLETGELPKTERDDWNYPKLIKIDFHPVGAFLMLDWLDREPEKAKKALARGFDSVIIK
jgi:hypothetical protein